MGDNKEFIHTPESKPQSATLRHTSPACGHTVCMECIHIHGLHSIRERMSPVTCPVSVTKTNDRKLKRVPLPDA